MLPNKASVLTYWEIKESLQLTQHLLIITYALPYFFSGMTKFLKTFLFCNLQLVVSNFLQSPAELICQWKFLFLLVSFPREINCMLKRTQHDSILHSSHCYIRDCIWQTIIHRLFYFYTSETGAKITEFSSVHQTILVLGVISRTSRYETSKKNLGRTGKSYWNDLISCFISMLKIITWSKMLSKLFTLNWRSCHQPLLTIRLLGWI